MDGLLVFDPNVNYTFDLELILKKFNYPNICNFKDCNNKPYKLNHCKDHFPLLKINCCKHIYCAVSLFRKNRYYFFSFKEMLYYFYNE